MPLILEFGETNIILTNTRFNHAGRRYGKMASTATDAAVEQKARPTKPDEAEYKANLAKAEKEHAAVQEKLVRTTPVFFPPWFSNLFYSNWLLTTDVTQTEPN